MRTLVLALLAALLLTACPEKPSWQTRPLSESGETVYNLTGSIQSRDAVSNTVMVKHDRIEGFMEAMTMEFTVRGVSVDSLPPDGSRIAAKLHVMPERYWLTDVTPSK